MSRLEKLELTRTGNGRLIIVIATLILGGYSFALADEKINTGADGICQTPANPNDQQIVPVGRGFPNTTCVRTGPDGICQTAVLLGCDDYQLIPVGSGLPNQICIFAGPNNLLDEDQGGDDVRSQGVYILTGPNGKCETAAKHDDLQVIPVGNGEADAICILSGDNGISESEPNQGSDDTLVIPLGRGKPHQPCVFPGGDHILQTTPLTDDEKEGTPPDPVPTLSEWAIIVATAIMLFLVSFAVVRRKRVTIG